MYEYRGGLTGSRGALAAAAPVVRAEMGAMENELIARTLTALGNGSLTPDAALAAWTELRAMRLLVKKLETRAALGVDEGSRNANILQISQKTE